MTNFSLMFSILILNFLNSSIFQHAWTQKVENFKLFQQNLFVDREKMGNFSAPECKRSHSGAGSKNRNFSILSVPYQTRKITKIVHSKFIEAKNRNQFFWHETESKKITNISTSRERNQCIFEAKKVQLIVELRTVEPLGALGTAAEMTSVEGVPL